MSKRSSSDFECKSVYSIRNNQQMQLSAVNFIPLLSSLYMFRAAHTPIIRSTTVSTATGTKKK